MLLAWQHEKKTYDILVKQLGEEDSRTHDSQNWMKTFKMRELQVNSWCPREVVNFDKFSWTVVMYS